jgi:ribosomal protein S14
MAAKFFLISKYNIRINYTNNNINYFVNKIINNDKYIPIGMNNNYINKCKKKSISLITNKCLISGRARATINKFKMSRMIFKKYSEFGFINGIRKACW